MENLRVHICAGLLIATANYAALAQAQPVSAVINIGLYGFVSGCDETARRASS